MKRFDWFKIMSFLDLELAYEKRPIITGISVLVSHLVFLPALASWAMFTFPEYAESIATILMWTWLAWMIISGAATIKYLEKVIRR